MDFISWAMSPAALGARRTPANNLDALRKADAATAAGGDAERNPRWLWRYCTYIPRSLLLLCSQVCEQVSDRHPRQVEYGRLTRELIRRIIENGHQSTWTRESDVRDSIAAALQFGLIVKLSPAGPGDFGRYAIENDPDAIRDSLKLFVEISVAKRRVKRPPLTTKSCEIMTLHK